MESAKDAKGWGMGIQLNTSEISHWKKHKHFMFIPHFVTTAQLPPP